jgi:hypothetical protein
MSLFISLSDHMLHISEYLILFPVIYGLVVRVPGYRSRGPVFDFRRYQIFCEVVGLERSSLSLVWIVKELFEWKSSDFGLQNRD